MLRPRSQAVGTELAASWLAKRFAHPGSPGIQELCQDFALLQHTATHDALPVSSSSSFKALPSEVATLLVSLSDQAFTVEQPAFRPADFVPHVVQQLWAVTNQLVQAGGPTSSSVTQVCAVAASVETVPEMKVVGEVCAKLIRRGFVSEVSQTLWQQAVQHQHTLHDGSAARSNLTNNLTSNHQQQQQQQQPHQPNQPPQQHLQTLGDKTDAHLDTAVGDEHPSEQTTRLQSPLCTIAAALEDPDALDKLLRCMLVLSSQVDVAELEGQSSAVMQCLVSTLWDRKHIRQAFQDLTNRLHIEFQWLCGATWFNIQIVDSLQHQLTFWTA